MCLHAFTEWTDNLHSNFPRSCVCSSAHLFSILNLAATRTFFNGISASTREHHYPFSKQWISSYNILLRKMFGNHVVFIFIIVIFFSGINNSTGHWTLCNIPFVIAFMLSSEERGILNQGESDTKISPLFLNNSSFSAVRCMVTWAIFGMSNNFCRQKQNKRNQTQDCAVWGEGHFTLEFYPH